MSIKKNTAYAGEHLSSNGRVSFTIWYRDRYDAAQINKMLIRPHPRISPHYPRTGWFFRRSHTKSWVAYGPFTSSQKAYKRAMETLR